MPLTLCVYKTQPSPHVVSWCLDNKALPSLYHTGIISYSKEQMSSYLQQKNNFLNIYVFSDFYIIHEEGVAVPPQSYNLFWYKLFNEYKNLESIILKEVGGPELLIFLTACLFLHYKHTMKINIIICVTVTLKTNKTTFRFGDIGISQPLTFSLINQLNLFFIT